MKQVQPSEESPTDVQQSPNVPTTWSTTQNPKPSVYDNPRFTQIDLSMQPNAPAGMGFSAKDPVRLVTTRTASCDGGVLALHYFGFYFIASASEIHLVPGS